MVSIFIPNRMWIEFHDDDPDACDVLVEMDDGTIFTSLFVTPTYLQRQMELSYDLSRQIPDTVPVRFAVLDTPHIAVECLSRDAIEDTIDNLLAMDVFESVFTQVTEGPAEMTTPTVTTGGGRRATQEVAAVVLSDVLMVEEE